MPLLALLKHPSAAFDAVGVMALERAILRGPRPKHGTTGLEDALSICSEASLRNFVQTRPSSLHRSDPRLSLTDAELDAAAALVTQLKTALAPLENISERAQSIAAMAQRIMLTWCWRSAA